MNWKTAITLACLFAAPMMAHGVQQFPPGIQTQNVTVDGGATIYVRVGGTAMADDMRSVAIHVRGAVVATIVQFLEERS